LKFRISEEHLEPNSSGECAAQGGHVDLTLQARNSGLAGAFDNAAFKERADDLLNHHAEEDLAADRTVISVPESLPTGCSPYHSLIQEKYSAIRYNKAAKR